MSNTFSLDDIAFEDTQSSNAMPILDTNWQTTAAVGLTVATGGVTGAIMLAAFPAQTIATVAGIGTLAYAGKNRADGKSAFPFMDKQSDKTEAPAAEAAA